MKICTITPTRGQERKQLFEFCKEQIDRQNVQPLNRYYMAFDPLDSQKDLTKRIRHGWELAKKDGMEWAVIMEDDDSYNDKHIANYAQFMPSYDFIGDPWTTYYRIDTRRHETEHHHGRASLFTTAFRVSALDNFSWPPDDHVFLDIEIWKHARKYKTKFVKSGAIGIKGHGFGMVGGKGHRSKLKTEDVCLNFLKANVGPRQFEFYSQLMKRF
jgi:hypothetical protein